MTDRAVPTLAKWPFILGDVALLALAGWVVGNAQAPLGPWPLVICFGAVASGAWLCAIPFLREYGALLKFAEAEGLTTAVAEIQKLEHIRSAIADATARWQSIQEQAGKTVQSAREVTEQMASQTQEFHAFFQRANDQEKGTLRLELDKMKRAEADGLQALVRILDNVHVLHQAGVRSGQQQLIAELTNFQNACREAARRIGLVPFSPAPAEAFDGRFHQLSEGHTKPEGDSRVGEVLAPGFTFQTQLLRRALVKLASPTEAAADRADVVRELETETNSVQRASPPASPPAEQPTKGNGREDGLLL